MGLFNPRKYSPFMEQFGQAMQQGAQGPQNISPYKGLAAALSKGLGAIMAGGQRKARGKDEETVMAALAAAKGMQPQTEAGYAPAMSGKMVPGTAMPGMGFQEVDVPTETQAEFSLRKQSAKIKALMASNIPEYKAMGQKMMLASITEVTPNYQAVKGDNGLIKLYNTKDGTSFTLEEGSGKKAKLDEYDPTKWHTDDGGNLYPPMEAANTYDPKVREVGENGNVHVWNLETETFDDTGLKAKDKASLVTVNTGDMTKGGPPTTSALTKVYDKFLQVGERLTQQKSIMDKFTATDYTMPDRAKQEYEKFRAWLGPLGDHLPEWKPGDEVVKTAYRQAEVARVANEMIRDLTGAQMTVQEVPRLLRGIMSPDDDPFSAWAKGNYVLMELERIHATYARLLGGDEKEAMMERGYSEQDIADYIDRHTRADVKAMEEIFVSMDEAGTFDIMASKKRADQKDIKAEGGKEMTLDEIMKREKEE